MNKDEAIGFTVYIDSNVYELHRGCTSWSVFENGEEVFEGGYRRALQIIVNRIGCGDIQ